MIKCPACGTDNLDGSQFCDECGASLNNFRGNNEADGYGNSDPTVFRRSESGRNSEADSFAPAYAPPAYQSANVTSVGIPAIVDEPQFESDGQAVVPTGVSDAPKGFHALLVIERGAAVGTEFGLTSEESYIGRWDADNGVFPDVDLDAHDPEAKVSRRHARIVFENERYLIEDLGSTNGTFVNRGRRLIPGNRQSLNDGDEVIVGKTFLRFRINQ